LGGLKWQNITIIATFSRCLFLFEKNYPQQYRSRGLKTKAKSNKGGLARSQCFSLEMKLYAKEHRVKALYGNGYITGITQAWKRSACLALWRCAFTLNMQHHLIWLASAQFTLYHLAKFGWVLFADFCV